MANRMTRKKTEDRTDFTKEEFEIINSFQEKQDAEWDLISKEIQNFTDKYNKTICGFSGMSFRGSWNVYITFDEAMRRCQALE